jgi:hypothetical protein
MTALSDRSESLWRRAGADGRMTARSDRSESLWRRPGAVSPQIEIVVHVRDEEAALALSVRRLHRFLTAEFPFT